MRINADFYSTQRHINFQPVILFWRAVGTSQQVLWANFKAFFLLFISYAEKIRLSTYLHWSVRFCSNWLPPLFVSTQINSVSKTASIFIWIWSRLEHSNREDTYLKYLFAYQCGHVETTWITWWTELLNTIMEAFWILTTVIHLAVWFLASGLFSQWLSLNVGYSAE